MTNSYKYLLLLEGDPESNPFIWAREDDGEWQGYFPEDRAIVLKGPSEDFYWDAWSAILNYSYRVDKEGFKWFLHEDEKGDLYEYREDYDFPE